MCLGVREEVSGVSVQCECYLDCFSLSPPNLPDYQSEGVGSEGVEGGGAEAGDLFSGAREMEVYQESMAVKRLLRSSNRLGLPKDIFS